MATNVGVISDTHKLLRPEAIAALQMADLILHAGDIGAPEVLEKLEAIAPVIAVRGNNDKGEWAEALPEEQTVTVESVAIHLLHIVKNLNLAELGAEVQVVISGHSHKPQIEQRDGILFLNPGSAGPRRFKLPICLAFMHIDGTNVETQMVSLVDL
ncbi:metallophosphoesterase family protein [Oscillatoria sp. FACHB-1407]|uniref:metallophosphoesterase family protein n=1 Tax=Oscillatoria sp. FACHB-1407 TaxID=2692847 RepID=UPI001685276E|nr:metallophosphoesterase family protein [Oscillatoria sp. FACHB-1407]MBD2464845.1 metallophosphoesterase family protein [Oscillatoria sp. FACHB-1407]